MTLVRFFISITLLISSLFLLISLAYAQGILPADDESSKKIVAQVIAAEACGEGQRGMELVAQVIRNRAQSWGKTAVQIVTAKNQFYGYTAKNKSKLYQQCRAQADETAKRMATDQLGNDTSGALYFRQPQEPVYSWHKIETFRFKNHVFYR